MNPVWEETAFLLVTDDEIKAQEDLAATLWDSDKRSADDLVGRVTVPLGELMAKVRLLSTTLASALLTTLYISRTSCTLAKIAFKVSRTRTKCLVFSIGKSATSMSPFLQMQYPP